MLTHALIDALLGAAGAGDIGRRYGSEAVWTKDIQSLRLLEDAAAAVADMGYAVANADATVVAEAPRLAPHLASMRANLARAMRVREEQVNVKATTAKLMGLIGSGDGIATFAIVAVVPTVPPALPPTPPGL